MVSVGYERYGAQGGDWGSATRRPQSWRTLRPPNQLDVTRALDRMDLALVPVADFIDLITSFTAHFRSTAGQSANRWPISNSPCTGVCRRP